MDESRVLETLFPGPRRYVLAVLFTEPSRWWSLADLAGRAGVPLNSLRRHVTDLRDSGLVREKKERRTCWVQADAESPVFPELHSIVAKLAPKIADGNTILVVEDQPATAQITRILLESWGYRVIETHGAGEAIEAFDREGGSIQLLLTDVNMPGMCGRQLASTLAGRNPALRVVMMSGYPDECHGDESFLAKPFNPVSLSRVIRRELDRQRRVPREMKSF